MAFTNAWVETDPDGSVITVSLLDDAIRLVKAAIRERLEGDPADPDLTGLIESGSFTSAPKPRKGTARIYIDTDANIHAYDATKLEDGRLAFATDTKKLYHCATAGIVEVTYLTKALADTYYDTIGAAAAITLAGLGGITKAQADGWYDALGAAAAITLAGLGGITKAQADTYYSRRLASFGTDVANVGTGDNTVWTYTLPANTLDVDGKGLRLSFGIAMAANANNKAQIVSIGGTNNSVIYTADPGNTYSVANLLMFRTDSYRIRTQSTINYFGGGCFVSLTETVVDFGIDNDISIVLAGGASNDLYLKSVMLELLGG